MTESNETQTALTAFDLFRSEQCLRVLELLAAEDTPIDCEVVVMHLRGESSTVDPSSLADDLHHAHLPLIDEAGVIEYDRGQRCVSDFDEERFETLVEETLNVLDSLDIEV